MQDRAPAPLMLPLMVGLLVLAHTAFGGGRVALMLHAMQLGGSALEVGVLVGLLAAVPMLISVHAGRWTDRVGAARPLLYSLCMILAGLAVLGGWQHRLALVPAAVLLGTGFMLAHLATNNAAGQIGTPQQRTSAFSMVSLGISISTVAGPVIAGVLIDVTGHALTFMLLALLPLLGLGILYKLAPLLPTPVPRAPSASKPRVLDLLRHVPLRAVFIVSSLLSMGWDLFTFMVPMHGSRIGLSASTIGLIMGAFGVGTFVVRLAIGRLSRRFSEWQVLAAALALTALIYALYPLFEAVPMLLTLAFVLGLGLGCAMPMILSAIHHTAPAGRSGEAIGIRSSLINASQSVLPALFGLLGATVGVGSVFWVSALMLAGGCLYARRQAGIGAAR